MLRGSIKTTSLLKYNSVNFLRNTGTRMSLSTKTTNGTAATTDYGSSSDEQPQVLFTVRDTARVVTLNRPQKLNALNTNMCSMMFNTLNEYSKSDMINLVILKSSNGKRSFCAGGDVATVASWNLAKEYKKSVEFFQHEYSLNFQLATFNKPIISIMDGITMGGGVGLSIHTPFRIATEYTKWAMPEMDIGFFPDVGVTFALPRVITICNNKSQMAMYLCLTGDVLNGEDAYTLGLASHYVTHENLANLERRLGEITEVDVFRRSDKYINKQDKGDKLMNIINNSIKEYSYQLPNNYKFRYSDAQLEVIEKCFDVTKVQNINDVIRNLASYEGSIGAKNFALEIKDKLTKKSFTSMNLVIRLLQDNSKDHIESSIRRDLYTAANMCHNNVDGLSEFSEATNHKLNLKNREAYPWKNNSKTILSTQVTSLTSPKPSIPLSLLKNSVDVTWNNYPFHGKYQLPTESFIRNLISKNDFTKESLIQYFMNNNSFTKDKVGVRHICNNIIRRKCKPTGESSLLKWID
ncbi:similar to Saccharomyces cerevisiae YDR036C EHD3 3-hydroxyisobutyryl-CoA hydrolase, member of a family of enoyl-CoA hydratase/isomerases [Maudiozyma saulgeensis]|uniref:3-hydroxyisobutyryl-CoA hydrolase n=1 Tax=Maudiozyma saulgeensis TaxID=1789683 RepID=A0A1X7R3V4_9SACH|nr:similar to Saccharomyces cerevisiae YDR036C EHD3 3-hydroxyisobutyryl-CoA hydrolase, member of a family of enoyl-CoA hydratase/isomerases [Kazachstania saulgeensis]